MINLIPKEEKKEMAKGFYYRLAVLFFVVVGISFLFACVAILPAYFLSLTGNNVAEEKLAAQKGEPVPLLDQQTLATIKDLNSKLDLIEKIENNKFNVSQKVINTIILKKMSGIKITDISYENDSHNSPPQGRKISIEGTAPSRSLLLSFRQALEDDPNFKQVDLPISNFVKDSNIQFYLSLIPE